MYLMYSESLSLLNFTKVNNSIGLPLVIVFKDLYLFIFLSFVFVSECCIYQIIETNFSKKRVRATQENKKMNTG